MEVDDKTKQGLMEFAEKVGGLKFITSDQEQESLENIKQMLQMSVSSPEYQFA